MTRVPSGALVLTIEESPPCVVGPISRAGALPSAGRIAIRPWPSEAYTKRGRLDCDTTWAVVLDRGMASGSPESFMRAGLSGGPVARPRPGALARILAGPA